MRDSEKARALKVARELALEAGAFLLKRQPGRRSITFKGGTANMVTEVDRASERQIVRRIRSEFPDHDIIAEEKERRETGARCRWHIDPLDGTTNYVHGFPLYAVSIGMEAEGKVQVGVVYAPVTNELFEAVRGGGARRNGKRISVSKRRELNLSLLVTGFSYVPQARRQNLEYFRRFLFAAQSIRRVGSAAIDLCYTACGIFDGFWEFKLGSWDIAAGSLIVEEAGGRVTSFSGTPVNLASGEVLATNDRIHAAMLKHLNGR